MSRATPRMRGLAKHLMVAETGSSSVARTTPTSVFPATDRLRPHLETLVGRAGVRALLARALVLASEELPWLRAARVNANGDLEGLEAREADITPAELLEARVVLLAQLLGLLVAFIGSSLTTRLVGEIWPDAPLHDRDFGKEHKREKVR